MRRSKLPIVKAKLTGVPMYGARIMTMVADERIFDIIPVKKNQGNYLGDLYYGCKRPAQSSSCSSQEAEIYGADAFKAFEIKR